MNLRDTQFIVVEDDREQRDEIFNALLQAGLEYGNCLAEAASFAGARDAIDQHAKELNLVLLDLNLPRDNGSDDLDKDFGYQLLRWIHNDINSRPGVNIRVIIISGEYADYGVKDSDFRKLYEGTLIDIAPKRDLPIAVKRSLAGLFKDDLLDRIQTLQLPIVDEYISVTDPDCPALKRLGAAKDIACRLIMNEGDFRHQRLGFSSKYSDKLSKALKELVGQRFDPDPESGQRHPSIQQITAGDSWGRFLWRGLMYQHIYAINTYYNQYKHLAQQPYTSPTGTQDEWTVSKHELEHFTDGHDAVQIVPVLVKELLRWYLPWHEQVYLPWCRKVRGLGGSGQ